MNNIKKYILFFVSILVISVNSLCAQHLKIVGEYSTGSVLFGIGEGIAFARLDTVELSVDEGKYFTFGFDRDDKDDHLLHVKLSDGRVYLKKIKLQQAKYRIQRINNIQQKHVTPPKKENDRIVRERKINRAANARIGEVKEAFFKNGVQRPIIGGRISGVFGSQRILNGIPKNIHNGLDIAIARGTPVYAMADGYVRLAADTFFYAGSNILIDHGQGLNSKYLHLSKMEVEVDQFVKKGQKIGEVGTTGRSTGPHLHWALQWFNKRVDPALLLKSGLNKKLSEK
jgi:murein DD-endopeptidase MepM/ murein hydrolase activator NlpD